MSKPRRVLLVAYYFPPIGGAGSQRPLKLAKYLPEFGWDVTVLTREPPSTPGRYAPQDGTMLDELPPSTRIVRLAEPASADTGSEFVIDGATPWSLAAGGVAAEICEAQGCDAVAMTMSPFSLVRAASIIRRRTTAPVLLDLRDPWAFDGWQRQRTYFDWRRQRDAMAEALASADGVVANTAESAVRFRRAIPGLEESRVSVVPNGYDAEDFEGAPAPAQPAPDGAFTLVFTGTMCSDVAERYSGVAGRLRHAISYSPEPARYWGRTPRYLLEAIRRLRERGDPLGKRVRLRWFGATSDADQRVIDRSGVADAVEVMGYASHRDSVRAAASADALFLPLHGLPRGVRSLIVPGKTYEYLASGRPVLACLPEGDARDLMAASGRAECADPCDADDIARALSRLVERSGKRSTAGDAPPHERFERRVIASRFAERLDRMLEQPRRAAQAQGASS